MPAAKVLFVDDERAVLDGYRRALHAQFEVATAAGGTQGLAALRGSGPYAVVVSDMRMPGMNGAEFLAEARRIAPESVRMLLTGYTDLGAAISAVNDGNIFRFLTKPCSRDTLMGALNNGVEQHRLLTSEKDLLEGTLMGSIRVLADVLSATSPQAFSRSQKVARLTEEVVTKMGSRARWRLKAAAALSQLGCITLPPDALQKAYCGEPMPEEQRQIYASHPDAASRLLSPIPRLEPVAWMIAQQLKGEIAPYSGQAGVADVAEIEEGARVLKLAVAFEEMRSCGFTQKDACIQLESRRTEFGTKLLDGLLDAVSEESDLPQRPVAIAKLATGMILEEEVRSHDGNLLVNKGQEITPTLMMRLENYRRAGVISGEILVTVP